MLVDLNHVKNHVVAWWKESTRLFLCAARGTLKVEVDTVDCDMFNSFVFDTSV
jgi:hypothetical protein